VDENPGERAQDFHYHLELTPAQLKITHTALKSLLDDFGHEEHDVAAVIHEVLDKLPDEHSIRAIVLDEELRKRGPSGGR
jgi:hypothetical protein